MRKTGCAFLLTGLGMLISLAAAQAADSGGFLPISHYEPRGLIPAAPKLAQKAGAPSLSAVVINSATTYSVDLRQAGWIRNNRITLTNCGTADIIHPRMAVNGSGDWFDASSMVAEILQGETDPNRKAFRIWRFLRRQRYHWPPADDSDEVNDPVKFINVYGYGFCDNSANNAEALFTKAGFAQARCWGLGRHVVPEVYYDDAWHMLDPDLETFYPQSDNVHVAGVEDLMKDGRLVERVSGADVALLYTSQGDNEPFSNYWIADHKMAIILRPGESLERCWFNWGKYHAKYSMPPPPVYGNGRVTWAPALTEPAFMQGLQAADNLVQDASGTLPIHRASAAAPGVMVLAMKSPYVFVGGQVTIQFLALTGGDTITAEISGDGVNWASLGQIRGPFDGPGIWFLDDAAQITRGACYEFFIRITMKGGQPGSIGLRALKVAGDIQCAPLALPALAPGRINRVAVRWDGGAGGKLRIEHEYESSNEGGAAGAKPAAAANINLAPAPTTFYWSGLAPAAPAYEVMISWDQAGVVPVCPPLWQILEGTQSWTPPGSWLLPGRQYFFHVKAVEDKTAAPGESYANQWSLDLGFTPTYPANAVRSWASYP